MYMNQSVFAFNFFFFFSICVFSYKTIYGLTKKGVMFLLSSPRNFGRLVVVNGKHLRWDSCKVFFHGNTFVLFLKETAVKWCIAFMYLCNIVHVYFFYLCYCLWITEPCPWISDSLISIYSKWKILNLPRWYCFWFVSCCFLPLPSL